MAYKLRAALRGHDADVRAVAPAVFPDGGVLTASRDKTCRLWMPDDSGGFYEAHLFSGHTKYISSVLVATGGNDNLIFIYSLESTEPLFRLEGHTGTVCSLAAGRFGTLMSGSWDMTARVWINDKSVMELKGHKASVWAVQMMPDQGLMLTGSADKSIKLWKASHCERTFQGHTDCVRGIAIFSSEEFLSCSNDSTVRRWSLSGECLQIYNGHTSFIYSICAIPSEDGTMKAFATSGEDRALRIWTAEKCLQSITLPSQSAWTVSSLPNGDVVVGTSDGIARIFTSNKERIASDELIKEFEEEVANQAIPAATSMDLGDIKIDQLPGPEALLRPGHKDEQTKLIKRSGVIEAHQWDQDGQRWQKVGEVVGAAGEEGSSRKVGKKTFNGKEYDYVFDVDIQEGKPPLKLPYNVTDDPWLAAHNFLQANELSPLFLDQVANFIIKNTEGVTIGGPANPMSDPFTGGNRYVPGGAATPNNPSQPKGDPFTGGSRYIPGSSTTTNGVQGSDRDPFTGGSSYVPISDVKKAVQENKLPESTYFPKKSFLFFETGKVPAIIGKIKELNTGIDEDKVLTADDLNLLEDILQRSSSGNLKEESLPSQTFQTLEKILRWPLDKVYPGLDSLRLLICSKNILDYFIKDEDDSKFINFLFLVSRKDAPAANGMLACKILCNCFRFDEGMKFILVNKNKIIDYATTIGESENKNARIAAASVLLKTRGQLWRYFVALKLLTHLLLRILPLQKISIANLTVMCKNQGSFEDRASLIFTICQILLKVADLESQFRLLVALGTIIHGDGDAISLCKSLEVENRLDELATVTEPPKVGESATQLSALLKSFR